MLLIETSQVIVELFCVKTAPDMCHSLRSEFLVFVFQTMHDSMSCYLSGAA